MNNNFYRFKPRIPWLFFLILLIISPRLFFIVLLFYAIYIITKNLFDEYGISDKLRNSSFNIKDFFSKGEKVTDTKESDSKSNFFIAMEPKFKASYIFIGIGILFLFLIIVDGLVSVPVGHVAVIYDRGRGVLDESLPEGLHLKIPLWQVSKIMDTRLQASTMSVAPAEGEKYGDDSIESLTKDGQKVFIDITLQYRISGDDAPWIYQQIGLDYQLKVVRPGARNVIRDIVTGYDSTKLFTQETRTEAQEKMKEALSVLYAKNKIKLENILLRNIKFSEVYLQAIEDKQIAQQRIQKAEYEKDEAIQLKEKKIIEAQAEAEAIRLKGVTLKANPQVIQFEFVQKMAPQIQWGILPDTIMPLLDLKSLQ